jgi:hypothetical protein
LPGGSNLWRVLFRFVADSFRIRFCLFQIWGGLREALSALC